MIVKRRKVERAHTSIPCEWGVSKNYNRSGKILSLSAKGCLISTDHVEPLYGKTIHLRFPLPDDEWMTLEGEVIYYLRDVGFAVEFAGLTDMIRYLLSRLVEGYRKGDPFQSPPGVWKIVTDSGEIEVPKFVEHRKYPRARVSINLDWGTTSLCEFSGDKITSLSVGGCFLQTERVAREGSPVYIRLLQMEGRKGVFEGVVRYRLQLSPRHAQIGLGIEFADLNINDMRSIQEVLNYYSKPK